jgi:hypothetical protein
LLDSQHTSHIRRLTILDQHGTSKGMGHILTTVYTDFQTKIMDLLSGTIDPIRESVRIRDNAIRDIITTRFNRPAVIN